MQQLEDFKATSHYQKIHQQIVTLGLEPYIKGLDERGYTVIPPDLVAPPEFNEAIRRAVLKVHERRTGQKIGLDELATGTLAEDTPLNGHFGILTEDPVFQEVIMNPTVLAMAKYQCGNSVVLSDIVCLLKQQDERPTHQLHSDQVGTPPPLPPYAQVANVTWTLTDYNEENGPTAIVPRSHLRGHHPNAEEADFLRDDAPVKAIKVAAPAGSLIVWHGATWHASYPRRAPGLRLNLVLVFTRVYMKQIQDFRATVPKEILDAHPVEFARLIGANSAYPWAAGRERREEDIQYMQAAGQNPWA